MYYILAKLKSYLSEIISLNVHPLLKALTKYTALVRNYSMCITNFLYVI
jgi:hypothetical protein